MFEEGVREGFTEKGIDDIYFHTHSCLPHHVSPFNRGFAMLMFRILHRRWVYPDFFNFSSDKTLIRCS